VHPGRIGVHAIQQGRTRTGLVPLRIAGPEKPLVCPPDVHMPPVDGVAGRRYPQFGEHRRADAASGQHHRRGPARSHRIDQPGNKPRRDRLGQQLRVIVHDHLGHAH